MITTELIRAIERLAAKEIAADQDLLAITKPHHEWARGNLQGRIDATEWMRDRVIKLLLESERTEAAE